MSGEESKEDKGSMPPQSEVDVLLPLQVLSSTQGTTNFIPRSASGLVSLPPTYVSPAASSGDSFPQDSEQRTTIDNPSKGGNEYGDSMSQQPASPQLHPFHPMYDSEESDGSIVLNYASTPGTSPLNYDALSRMQGQQQHQRFPSFDSIASTGSFRIMPPAPSPYGTTTHTYNQKPPAMLPYDERRKLQLKRQQQQQQQFAPQNPTGQLQRNEPVHRQQLFPLIGQHLSNSGYTLPTESGHGTVHSVYSDQQLQHSQPPPAYSYMYSPPPTHPQQHLPPSGYRSSQGKPTKLETIGAESNRAPPQHPPHYHQNPPPGHTHALPPIGNYRNVGSMGGSGMRGRTSSADSTSPEKERPTKQASKTKDGRAPPPPPPPPSYHLRADSSESISSLGSSGGGPVMTTLTDRLDTDIVGFINQEKIDPNAGGFVGGIMNYLSPRERRYSVEDFHKQNQKFLEKTKRYPSPQQTGRSPKLHRPNLRTDTPPRSRGGHRRLTSIENDEWEEQDNRVDSSNRHFRTEREANVSGMLSSGEVSDVSDVDEQTSLLPPPGISSREYTEDPRRSKRNERRGIRESERSGRYTEIRDPDRSKRLVQSGEDPTQRFDNHTVAFGRESVRRSKKHKRKKHRMEDRRRSRRHRQPVHSDDSCASDDSLSSSSENFDHRQWEQKRVKMFEKERIKLFAEWKAQARAEAERIRTQQQESRWHKRMGRAIETTLASYLSKIFRFLALAEAFISNLPLTIGAVALAIVTLGVVWFKYAEENLDSCEPVHFHSSQCTFPEFPGCFYCDTDARMYRVAVNFHFTCSAIAGVLSMAFVLKVILATRVVLDELSSPTTASPAGLICMTTVCVFAGRGWIGQLLVSIAAGMHLCLAIWFIYCALAYHIMPEPSWFPNTVGIGLSAVKAWLYYPMSGHLLMAISLSLNFFFFPISLIRVTLNQKISAPVGWIQMSAPAISLYALTIMAQPSFEEEHPDVTKFERVHRMIYLPCMHFLFALAVLGALSSVQSLIARWDDFKKKEFSPAHAAFCFPTLAHANAIQAYRAAVNSFSDMPSGTPFKIALYTYWVVVLVIGTMATVYVTFKFFYMLPTWTHIDVADEVEPPAPYETTLTLQDIITTGETMRQPFVSPAVLQANETGALVMLPRGVDGRNRYVRTRRLPALGFEPTMGWSELNRERELLLDWVGKNPPRRRKRTLSVPGIDFNYGYGDFGSGNSGVYGSLERNHSRGASLGPQRMRANTGGEAPSWQQHYP